MGWVDVGEFPLSSDTRYTLHFQIDDAVLTNDYQFNSSTPTGCALSGYDFIKPVGVIQNVSGNTYYVYVFGRNGSNTGNCLRYWQTGAPNYTYNWSGYPDPTITPTWYEQKNLFNVIPWFNDAAEASKYSLGQVFDNDAWIGGADVRIPDPTNVTVGYVIPALEVGTYASLKLAVKKNNIPTNLADADIVIDIEEPTNVMRIGSATVTGLDERSHYYFVIFLEDDIGNTASSEPKDCTTGVIGDYIIYDNTQNPVYIDSAIDSDNKWYESHTNVGIKSNYLGQESLKMTNQFMSSSNTYSKSHYKYLYITAENLGGSGQYHYASISTTPSQVRRWQDCYNEYETVFTIPNSSATPNNEIRTIRKQINNLGFNDFHITIFGSDSCLRVYRMWLTSRELIFKRILLDATQDIYDSCFDTLVNYKDCGDNWSVWTDATLNAKVFGNQADYCTASGAISQYFKKGSATKVYIDIKGESSRSQSKLRVAIVKEGYPQWMDNFNDTSYTMLKLVDTGWTNYNRQTVELSLADVPSDAKFRLGFYKADLKITVYRVYFDNDVIVAED